VRLADSGRYNNMTLAHGCDVSVVVKRTFLEFEPSPHPKNALPDTFHTPQDEDLEVKTRGRGRASTDFSIEYGRYVGGMLDGSFASDDTADTLGSDIDSQQSAHSKDDPDQVVNQFTPADPYVCHDMSMSSEVAQMEHRAAQLRAAAARLRAAAQKAEASPQLPWADANQAGINGGSWVGTSQRAAPNILNIIGFGSVDGVYTLVPGEVVNEHQIWRKELPIPMVIYTTPKTGKWAVTTPEGVARGKNYILTEARHNDLYPHEQKWGKALEQGGFQPLDDVCVSAVEAFCGAYAFPWMCVQYSPMPVSFSS